MVQLVQCGQIEICRVYYRQQQYVAAVEVYVAHGHAEGKALVPGGREQDERWYFNAEVDNDIHTPVCAHGGDHC